MDFYSSRLFSHADDPDIDDPFEAPKGHTLGNPPDGTKHFTNNLFAQLKYYGWFSVHNLSTNMFQWSSSNTQKLLQSSFCCNFT